jgi:hypothetical protein
MPLLKSTILLAAFTALASIAFAARSPLISLGSTRFKDKLQKLDSQAILLSMTGMGFSAVANLQGAGRVQNLLQNMNRYQPGRNPLSYSMLGNFENIRAEAKRISEEESTLANAKALIVSYTAVVNTAVNDLSDVYKNNEKSKIITKSNYAVLKSSVRFLTAEIENMNGLILGIYQAERSNLSANYVSARPALIRSAQTINNAFARIKSLLPLFSSQRSSLLATYRDALNRLDASGLTPEDLTLKNEIIQLTNL